ncbi:uncharacterized protein [Narcine bancroftii]|uniref:uncharacterized protein isoform X2 n=1 Tax=Narcine bancroftii TaxID=1343680 RepID=UPI003831C6FC
MDAPGGPKSFPQMLKIILWSSLCENNDAKEGCSTHWAHCKLPDQKEAQQLRDPHSLQAACGQGNRTGYGQLETGSWERGLKAEIREGAEGKKGSQRASGFEGFLIMSKVWTWSSGCLMNQMGGVCFRCRGCRNAGGKSMDSATLKVPCLQCLDDSIICRVVPDDCIPFHSYSRNECGPSEFISVKDVSCCIQFQAMSSRRMSSRMIPPWCHMDKAELWSGWMLPG